MKIFFFHKKTFSFLVRKSDHQSILDDFFFSGKFKKGEPRAEKTISSICCSPDITLCRRGQQGRGHTKGFSLAFCDKLDTKNKKKRRKKRHTHTHTRIHSHGSRFVNFVSSLAGGRTLFWNLSKLWTIISVSQHKMLQTFTIDDLC